MTVAETLRPTLSPDQIGLALLDQYTLQAALNEKKPTRVHVERLQKGWLKHETMRRQATAEVLLRGFLATKQNQRAHAMVAGAVKDPKLDAPALERVLNAAVPLRDYVDAWVKAHAPAWLEYADPQDLKDPRLSNLSRVLNRPRPTFWDVEITKLQVLAARDSKLDIGERGRAFAEAVVGIGRQTNHLSRFVDVVRTVTDDGSASVAVRSDVLAEAAWFLLDVGRPDLIDGLLPTDGPPGLTRGLGLGTLSACTARRGADAKTVAAKTRALLEAPLTYPKYQCAAAGVKWLLSRGELALAEPLVELAGSVKSAPDNGVNAEKIPPYFTSMIRRARKSAPIGISAWRVREKHARGKAPKGWEDWIELPTPEVMTLQDVGGVTPLWFGGGDFRGMDSHEMADGDLVPVDRDRQEVFSKDWIAALQTEGSDFARSLLVAALVTDWNIDPEIAQSTVKALSAYDDIEQHPETATVLRFHRAVRQHTRGKRARLAPLLEAGGYSRSSFSVGLALRLALLRSDAELERVLDDLEPDQLRGPATPSAVRAFVRLGRVKDAARLRVDVERSESI